MRHPIPCLAACIALMTVATSCYQDIDLDKYKGQEGENMLTLNSIVNPDSTVAVAATRTFFYSDDHPDHDYITGLDIALYINGEPRGSLTYNENRHLYMSTVKPLEGDEVELRTVYDNKPVSCKGIIPRKISIESIDASVRGPLYVYTGSDYIVSYEVTFTDPADEGNYYFLQYDKTSHLLPGITMGERDFTDEYVFQQLARRINAVVPGWEPYCPYGLPFSDYGIDGETHTLLVKEILQTEGWSFPPANTEVEMPRKFMLYAISRDYYEYLVSVLYNNPLSDGLHGGMVDIGVSEPMKYYNNIDGGVGVFGTYTLDTKDLDVMPLLRLSQE